MKKLLIFISIVIVGCNNPNEVYISGIVTGGEGSSIYLEQLDISRITELDSVTLKKDQTFSFKLTLENPELLILKNDRGEIINLLPAPGEKIKVISSYQNFPDYKIEGSPESEKIRNLVQKLGTTRHKLDSISAAISNLSNSEDPRLKILQNAYQQTFIDQKRYTIRFIVENVNSMSSVYALYQKIYDDLYVMNESIDLQYYKFVADSLKVRYPNSSLSTSLADDIIRREKQFEENKHLQELLLAAKETSILDVALPDQNGDTIRLADLHNKVVMLIFWSSKDSPGTKALISLQSTYKKYHDKGFEVYAISLDNRKYDWLTSINYNQFNWINVSELSYPNTQTDKLFNITKLPTNFLINKEGEMVTRDIYGRKLEVWLDNLL